MTAQRISQPRDLLYYRGKMRNACSPQASGVYHQLSPQKNPHGTCEYPGFVTKNTLYYQIEVFYCKVCHLSASITSCNIYVELQHALHSNVSVV